MERYTRIFSLPTNLYAEGSLVILEAGALLKDNANGTMLAQLKFKNVNPKAIKMLKVEIISKDSMGRDLEPATAYQYLDLHVYRNDSFGSQQAITLPDNSVRSFDVKILEIGLEDNSIVKGSEAKWEALPNPTKLDNSELSKQCQISYGDDFKYELSEFSDLWYCACGALNRKSEKTCHKCNRPFTPLSDSDIKELTVAIELRLAEEEHQRVLAEQKRKEDEAEAERIRKISEAEAAVRKKKISKLLALAGVTVAAVVTVFLLVTKVVIPTQQYNAAIALMDEGRYEEAISAFETMDGYKDSEEKIAGCYIALKDIDYNNAVALMNDGKYEEAILIFETMDGYKSSEEQIESCRIAIDEAIKDQKYSSAVGLMDSGKYMEAVSAFKEINGYKDSASMITLCKLDIIKRAKVGDCVYFGVYEQDNSTENGTEEIEWRVLEVQNGKVLLLSRYGLDAQPYKIINSDTTWEQSTLRSWLNDTFVNNAFSIEEQEAIALTNVDNSRSQGYSEWDTNGGNNTEDKIFLLSYAEANKYLGVTFDNSNNITSRVSPTGYAKTQGAYEDMFYNNKTADGTTAGWWWLRSPGIVQYSAARVNDSGSLHFFRVDYTIGCVRPALWISIE